MTWHFRWSAQTIGFQLAGRIYDFDANPERPYSAIVQEDRTVRLQTLPPSTEIHTGPTQLSASTEATFQFAHDGESEVRAAGHDVRR